MLAEKMKKLNTSQRFIKRTFDVFGSIVGLILTCWIIVPALIIARIDTGLSGIFGQIRVGMNQKTFTLFKIRSMKNIANNNSMFTTTNDPRITPFGRLIRKTKIDELPQLWNVLLGDMSFVGPRPDVPEVYESQKVSLDNIFSIRPGITGPASIAFRNEEQLLSGQSDPEKYSLDELFPKKILINDEYINNYSFVRDIGYIIKTLIPDKRS